MRLSILLWVQCALLGIWVLERVWLVKISKDEGNMLLSTMLKAISFVLVTSALFTWPHVLFFKTQIPQRHVSPADVANPIVQNHSLADCVSDGLGFFLSFLMASMTIIFVDNWVEALQHICTLFSCFGWVLK